MAGDALVRDALTAAPPAPPIGVGDPTRQHRAAGLQLLPDDLQTEVVERQNEVRSDRATVTSDNVEVLQVKTSEVPSRRHLDPHPANDTPSAPTLICEEPLYRPRERLGPGVRLDLADVQHSARPSHPTERASILAGTGGAPGGTARRPRHRTRQKSPGTGARPDGVFQGGQGCRLSSPGSLMSAAKKSSPPKATATTCGRVMSGMQGARCRSRRVFSGDSRSGALSLLSTPVPMKPQYEWIKGLDTT